MTAGACPEVWKLRASVRATLDNMARWYLTRKTTKKTWAVLLRVVALSASVCAALTPIVASSIHAHVPTAAEQEALTEAYESAITEGRIAPRDSGELDAPTPVALLGLAPTFLLALAGASVLIDRFWGHSTGWMRYIATHQAIVDIGTRWDLDIETAAIAWADPPTIEQSQAFLARTRTALVDAQAAVVAETKIWAVEFESSFALIGSSSNGGGKPT